LAAGALQAQAPVDGSAVVGGNVAGDGGDITIIRNIGGTGGGRSVLLSQPGWPARITTDSDGPQVEYLGTAPANPGLEAWMVCGGGDAEAVHRRLR
jgi:hypothetical protein